MVQFAGHHRAKVLNPPAVGFDPFAMGAGHDVHRRRGQQACAEELCLFAAHDVVVVFAGSAKPGDNPDPFIYGGQLVANGREIGGKR